MAVLEVQNENRFEEFMGTVRPKVKAVVESKLSGRIEQVLAAPGQTVKAGMILARIDSREVQAGLAQSTAAKAQADRDLARLTVLLRQGAVTQADFETAETRARIADAAVRRIQSSVNDAEVTAPFAGIVARKFAEEGDFAAPGKPLFELDQASGHRFQTDIPETLIETIALGAKMTISIPTIKEPLVGTVAEIATAGDPAGTFLVKFDLAAHAQLRGGLFGRVAVPVGSHAVIRVPAQAVVRRGQMDLVFVAKDNRAQARLVRVGKRTARELQLLSGVEAGERIVVENAAALRDGDLLQEQPVAP